MGMGGLNKFKVLLIFITANKKPGISWVFLTGIQPSAGDGLIQRIGNDHITDGFHIPFVRTLNIKK